jgi:hypothetical protein
MSIARLQKLLAKAEADAEALRRSYEPLIKAEADAASIRRSIELLGGDQAEAAVENHPAVLAQAVALDETRRAQTADTGFTSDRERKRQHTAAVLAQFDRVKPRKGTKGISALAQAGYVKRKGTGWVRTNKPFDI